MTCEKCDKPFVSHKWQMRTLLGYGVEPCGREHDDNCLFRTYVCPDGHHTSVSLRRSCPCGWKGRETCFCHAGKKVSCWPEIVAVEVKV
jgi:hypothetical protein